MSTPNSFKKLEVVELTKDFRKATRLVTSSIKRPIPDNHLLVKVLYAGINASDINFTSGAYFTDKKPPFDCGFEGVGIVEEVADNLQKTANPAGQIKKGDAVIIGMYGTFSEFICVPLETCIPIPSATRERIALNVSGLTAAISIGELFSHPLQSGASNKNKVALVTAAAGGTGQFAVQIFKHVYGFKVIGTCSNDEKVSFLKSIGCDEVINYKKEALDESIKKYAPNGLDVVYECVGGETFNYAVKNMAPKGVVIVIGAISQYKDGKAEATKEEPFEVISGGKSLPVYLIVRSISIRGFMLPQYRDKFAEYFKFLIQWENEKKIKSVVDSKEFHGVEAVADAVDHLYSGQSVGKVVVNIA